MNEYIENFVKKALAVDTIPEDLVAEIEEINTIIATGSKGQWDAYTPPELVPQLRSWQNVAQIIYNWKKRQVKLD
jgi:hypothetical protein